MTAPAAHSAPKLISGATTIRHSNRHLGACMALILAALIGAAVLDSAVTAMIAADLSS